jgi:hypothetical protein
LLFWHHTSHAIFAGNYRELKEILDFIHDSKKSLSLFGTESADKMHAVQLEVVRLFHNFVASAITLVEHTRILVHDNGVKEECRTEYKEKVAAEFGNDPLCGFVQDLRNYFFHRGNPLTGMELSFTRNPNSLDTRVFLDVKQMSEWKKWRSRSKIFLNFLNTVKDKLTLLEVIEAYTSKVRGFHTWFIEWFAERHKSELAEHESLQKKWNADLELIMASEKKRPRRRC